MQPFHWLPQSLFSRRREQSVLRIRRATLFVASRAIIGAICSMKRSNGNWHHLPAKQAFPRDWERQVIRCPAEQQVPFQPGGIVHFPQETSTGCPLRTR